LRVVEQPHPRGVPGLDPKGPDGFGWIEVDHHLDQAGWHLDGSLAGAPPRDGSRVASLRSRSDGMDDEARWRWNEAGRLPASVRPGGLQLDQAGGNRSLSERDDLQAPARLDQGSRLSAEVASAVALEIREQHHACAPEGPLSLEVEPDALQGSGERSLGSGSETLELADEGHAERRDGGTGKPLRKRAGRPRLVALSAQGDLGALW
jgi:hypothetical protein